MEAFPGRRGGSFSFTSNEFFLSLLSLMALAPANADFCFLKGDGVEMNSSVSAFVPPRLDDGRQLISTLRSACGDVESEFAVERGCGNSSSWSGDGVGWPTMATATVSLEFSVVDNDVTGAGVGSVDETLEVGISSAIVGVGGCNVRKEVKMLSMEE